MMWDDALPGESTLHETIEHTQPILLTDEDQRRFVELLLDRPAMTPALERAREVHAKLIRESR
jgi:uncharacterized protein (DUF1778 family)